MREHAVPPEPAPAAFGAEETARLVALWRLAVAAAHTLNNAFTTILGEASFLREDCKDPEVAEGCDVIIGEVERCAHLTRGLLARRRPAGGAGEVDLVRLARDLEPLLSETLGRRTAFSVAAPDELVLVHGEDTSLELLILHLVHFACDLARDPAALRLCVSPESEDGRHDLCVVLEVPETARERAEQALDARRVVEPEQRLALETVERIARDHGGTTRSGFEQGQLTLRVSLPALCEP